MFKIIKKEIELNGKKISLETGKIARIAMYIGLDEIVSKSVSIDRRAHV